MMVTMDKKEVRKAIDYRAEKFSEYSYRLTGIKLISLEPFRKFSNGFKYINISRYDGKLLLWGRNSNDETYKLIYEFYLTVDGDLLGH